VFHSKFIKIIIQRLGLTAANNTAFCHLVPQYHYLLSLVIFASINHCTASQWEFTVLYAKGDPQFSNDYLEGICLCIKFYFKLRNTESVRQKMLNTAFGVNARGCTDSTLVSRFKWWDPLVKRQVVHPHFMQTKTSRKLAKSSTETDEVHTHTHTHTPFCRATNSVIQHSDMKLVRKKRSLVG
jgi:hypothetical protein